MITELEQNTCFYPVQIDKDIDLGYILWLNLFFTW